MNMYKEELAEKAKKWDDMIESHFADECKRVAIDSDYYGPECPTSDREKGNPRMCLFAKGTTEAAADCLKAGKEKVAILNFASFKNPGGKFLEGSMAQEEAICHVTNLYEVLLRCPDYYQWNNDNKNNGLYRNRAIVSKGIRLFGKQEGLIDVITCAAPNNTMGLRYGKFTQSDNSACMRDRIRFLRAVCDQYHWDVLILGAWGCGVFRQDPLVVADAFKREFSDYDCPLIIYAIPDRGGNNYVAFEGVLNG